MLDRNAFGPLVAEYQGWRIVLNETPSTKHFPQKYIACNEGVLQTGDSIEEVVEQITSRVGELNRKDDAWSGGVCENH